MSFLWVAVGGALGSMMRFGLSLLLGRADVAHSFPLATLSANLLGSFGLGLVFVLAADRSWLGSDLRLLLGTGVMGGFTTYSTFNLESLAMIQDASWGRAGLYVAATWLLCLLAGLLGLWLGRLLRG